MSESSPLSPNQLKDTVLLNAQFHQVPASKLMVTAPNGVQMALGDYLATSGATGITTEASRALAAEQALTTAVNNEATARQNAAAATAGQIAALSTSVSTLQAVTNTVPAAPPVLAAPPSFTTPASSIITLVGVTFTDPGSVVANYPFAITCLHGTLSVAGATGGTLAGSGTASVSGSGNLATVKMALVAIVYTAPVAAGVDVILISVARSTTASYSATIAVTIGTATGSATGNNGGYPLFAFPSGPFNVAVGTALPVPGFAITDPPAVTDGGAGVLSVTVTGGGSTLAMVPSGVAVAGSGTAAIKITGTVATANAALATLTLTGSTVGTAIISAVYTDIMGFVSPIVTASVTVTAGAVVSSPANPVGPVDPSLSVPSLSITPGGVHTFTNIYWRDSYGATNTGLALVNLTADVGTVSVALQGGATVTSGTNGSAFVRVSGAFADVIACLSNITYTAPSTAGSANLNVDCYNGYGIEYHQFVRITVSAANAIALPTTVTVGRNTGSAITGIAFASTVGAATPAQSYNLKLYTNGYYGGDLSFANLSGCTLVSGGTLHQNAKGAIISGTYPNLQAALQTLQYGSYTSQPDTINAFFTDSAGNNLLVSNTCTITITLGATYSQGTTPTNASATESGGYNPGNPNTTTTTTPAAGAGAGAGATTISTGQTPLRIADMLDNRIGFNTFSGYGTGTDYGNVWGAYPSNFQAPMVISMLQWLFSGTGFTPRIREYHKAAAYAQQLPWIQQVHNATGALFELAGQQPVEVASAIQLTTALSTKSLTGGPIIDWLEPINEPNLNNWPIAQAVAAQQQVQAGVASLPGVGGIMSSIVLLGQPFTAYLSGYVDSNAGSYTATPGTTALAAMCSANNAHMYPGTVGDLDDGSANRGIIGDFITSYLSTFPSNKPLHFTEYHPTYYNNTANASTVQFNQPYDAYYYMWAIFSLFKNFQSGPLYYFALEDYGAAGTFGYATGLFGAAGLSAPKLAALSLHALLQLTGDTGTNKHSFVPSNFAYSISGMAPPINAASPYTGGQSMVLASSDGRVFIMFGNQQVVPGGASSPAVITFSAGAVTRCIEYDLTTNPANAMTPVQNVTGLNNITSNLNASMRLLVITR